jgi:hypothetical protein
MMSLVEETALRCLEETLFDRLYVRRIRLALDCRILLWTAAMLAGWKGAPGWSDG